LAFVIPRECGESSTRGLSINLDIVTTGSPAFAGDDRVYQYPPNARLDPQFSDRKVCCMASDADYFVYILASKIGGTIYVGVTNDLIRRIFDHKSNVVDGFTKKYSIHHLVYFEQFDDIENAIKREKRIKKWNRNWKIRLIEESNPNWTDLYPNLARQ
jgi:putative endonuclease